MNQISIFNEINDDLVNVDELESLASFTLNKEEVKNALVNVILVDNETIKEINKNYRQKDEITDVISFALEEGETFPTVDIRILGDIYVSVEKAKMQANEYKHSFKREISFLVVHGLLHLLGYSHETKELEAVMFKRQELILSEYGIAK